MRANTSAGGSDHSTDMTRVGLTISSARLTSKKEIPNQSVGDDSIYLVHRGQTLYIRPSHTSSPPTITFPGCFDVLLDNAV